MKDVTGAGQTCILKMRESANIEHVRRWAQCSKDVEDTLGRSPHSPGPHATESVESIELK